ncbi:MAG: outer membrane lipoprotein chaperone LolA [Magnetococcales bacterium]|nr:outer membrane lipoprotein chaperone LolA [Magnetococcales bacterium]
MGEVAGCASLWIDARLIGCPVERSGMWGWTRKSLVRMGVVGEGLWIGALLAAVMSFSAGETMAAGGVAPLKHKDAPALTASESKKTMDRLQRFVDQLKTLEAEFVSTVIQSAEGSEPEQGHGHFFASRPNRFRWDYETPFKQLLLSDGEWMWFYEPDLKQVTRTSAKTLAKTPAAFLISGGNIKKSFHWKVIRDSVWGVPTVQLKPREEGRFREIDITLHPAKEELVNLSVEDQLGNRSRFVFGKQKRNHKLPADKFVFKPPPDVDVVEEALPDDLGASKMIP